MLQQLTDNKYLSILAKSADNAAFRHNLLVNNISNVNTPGYKRRDVADFEKELREAMNKTSFKASTTNSKHIQFGRSDFNSLKPRMIVQDHLRYRNDKSSVDIDVEMAEMSKNGLRYQGYIRHLKGYFAGYNEILRGE